MNYKVTKIGLLNFWLYDEEEYDFSDGKLLLRGENGSGKSVTMQSFMPLILDGNKSPARLDPFGSTDKHIEAYLLGGIDSEQKDEAIGYLYMELFEEDKNKYLTIGMGLHAKRGRPVNFWGFALTDGRRINKDFKLYKNTQGKVPLSKNELKAALGSDNILVESTKEYKKMVNDLVFGFPNLDQYDEFINVLLQLRSPKLSKDYKPTKLMSILNGVLQPLTEEDLAPLSDAIEEMDKTKEKTEQLKNDIKNVSYLKKSYANYNETILYKKASAFLENVTKLNKYKEEVKQKEKQIEETNQFINTLKEDIEKTEIKLDVIKKERESIDSKDLDKATNRITEITGLVTKKEEENHKYNKEKENYDEKRLTATNENKALEEEIYANEKEMTKELDLADEISEEISFKDPINLLKEVLSKKEKIDFSYINSRVRSYSTKLNNLKEKLKEKTDRERKLGEEETEYEEIQKRYNEFLSQYESCQDSINVLLQNIKDEINLLQTNNKYIKFNDSEKDLLLDNFKEYDRNKYYEATNIYKTLATKYERESENELFILKEKRKASDTKIKELNITLEELKNKKEDEIIYDEEIESTIKYMNESNISYIPFYKAIEFNKDIDQKTKDRLESVLMISGILGSFIVDNKSVAKLKGHKGIFLTPSAKKKNNLGKYFTVSDEINVSKDLITSILESISIDKKELLSINEEEYNYDFIHGYGSIKDKSKYIGILARITAQKEKIKEQIDLIEAEQDLNSQLINLINKKKEELVSINIEKENFPDNLEIDKKYLEQEKILVSMSNKKEELARIEDKIKRINESLANIFKDIRDLRKDITIQVNLETISDACNRVIQLQDSIKNIETLNDKLRTNEVMQDINKERLEEIERNTDDLLIKMHENDIEISKLKKEKKTLEDLMNKEEYRDLAKRILELNDLLEKLPKEQDTRRLELGRREQAYINYSEDLEKMKQYLSRTEKEKEVREKILENEFKLGYVSLENTQNLDILAVARKIVSSLVSRKDADITKITDNYYTAYNDYHLKLSDYKLTSISLFENIFEDEDDEFSEIYKEARRNDYRVTYQGKNISLFELEKALEDTIKENEEIISEQDRKLFGEILLQTVGRKIREHIDKSKEWVKNINEIMGKMQKDAALSFTLEWRGKDSESLEEIDTKELIRLFKIPSEMIKDEDKAKLRNHFISKLRNKVELLNETHDSYANIIFEILDYRTWFEFKMYYTRNGENKKELTDKVFSVFSGGEKAKTMYLPLFTAIVAKLQSARKNALRLVALDEAFAGVDDANIREMFGIMSHLNLDYILTSQALWGDYDTIKSLSICELLRPNNSPVVGVRRYHWNGHVKEYMERKDETYANMELF